MRTHFGLDSDVVRLLVRGTSPSAFTRLAAIAHGMLAAPGRNHRTGGLLRGGATVRFSDAAGSRSRDGVRCAALRAIWACASSREASQRFRYASDTTGVRLREAAARSRIRSNMTSPSHSNSRGSRRANRGVHISKHPYGIEAATSNIRGSRNETTSGNSMGSAPSGSGVGRSRDRGRINRITRSRDRASHDVSGRGARTQNLGSRDASGGCGSTRPQRSVYFGVVSAGRPLPPCLGRSTMTSSSAGRHGFGEPQIWKHAGIWRRGGDPLRRRRPRRRDPRREHDPLRGETQNHSTRSLGPGLGSQLGRPDERAHQVHGCRRRLPPVA